jgi:hypothetical protein
MCLPSSRACKLAHFVEQLRKSELVGNHALVIVFAKKFPSSS